MEEREKVCACVAVLGQHKCACVCVCVAAIAVLTAPSNVMGHELHDLTHPCHRLWLSVVALFTPR